jgi:flagellar hook-associated protein 2
MASFFEGSKIGAFGDRMQMFGLGSKFDTKTILEANLNLIQMRNQPTYDLKANLAEEKTSWNSLKSSLINFQKLALNVKSMDVSNKEVTFSDESVATATATKDTINGTYDLEVSQLATAQRAVGDTMATGPMGITEVSKINGVDINITPDMSLRDIALKINDANAGAGAVVLDNKLILTSTKEGTANEMTFSGTSWDTLGITSGGAVKNEIQTAKDSIYKINGVQMTGTSNTITSVEGLELELKKVTTAPTTFTIDRNSDEIVLKVKGMIDGFNSMVNSLNSMSSETKILQGERIPRNIKNALSESVYKTQNDGNYMFELGVSLDKNTKNGLISFDETKFKEFYDKDPEQAIKMISGATGFSGNLDTIMNRFASATGEISGETTTIDNRIKMLDNKIERFEADFEKQKNSLIKKYAMFETMMIGLNSQNDYISAQLGQFQMDANQ